MLGKDVYGDNFGPPNWELVLCLAGAWLLIFLCLSRSVKSTGKVRKSEHE